MRNAVKGIMTILVVIGAMACVDPVALTTVERLEGSWTWVESSGEYLKRKTLRWNEGAVSKRFNNGDTVAIVDGPFTGFDAVFNGYLSSRDRCLVLLSSVSGIASVELSDRDIEAAKGSWRRRFGFEAG